MIKALVVLATLLGTGVDAQSYRVTKTGKVVDTASCYSFQIPQGWKAIWDNPVPLLFNFAPGMHPMQLQTLPPGAASLSIVDGASGEKPTSIEQWMAFRRRARPFSSVREIRYPPPTGITRAVEVRWTDRLEGEPASHTVATFFVFRRQLFASYLEYYATDRRRGRYLAGLATIMSSFRPLSDPTRCAVPTSR